MRRLLLGLVLALTGALVIPAAPGAARDELPALSVVKAPSYDGVRRFGRTLVAAPGRWSPAPAKVRYQWLRDGVPIEGADRRRYEIRPADVEHRLRLQVTASAPGYADTVTLVKVGRVKHRVDVRRTVRYSVRVKGRVGGGVEVFTAQAQQTFDDPRGWRGKGVRFVRVRNGGAMTLWLSEARLVPSFSSGCSAQWSCRVGRNVIINVQRWRHASPAWNAAKRSLRDYRHMVVNHETGHFLGYGHSSCPGRGQLAPVMMQQSKGTQGCRFNPWPTQRELRRR